MATEKESSIVFDNIVFENRNKSYGAYFLRQVYKNNILVAFVSASFLISVALGAPLAYRSWFGSQEEANEHENVSVVMETIKIEEPEIPVVEKVELPQAATIKSLPPEVKPDNEVKKEELPPTEDDLKDKSPGEETKEGKDINPVQPTGPASEPSPAPSVENKVYDWVPEAAMFPGGPSEFMKYLQKNVQYPERAIGDEIEGTVKVSFIVNIDGSITDVKIVKGVGYGLDEEAIRVIKDKRMPAWKPGRNKSGEPVRVRIVWPIVFDLQD